MEAFVVRECGRAKTNTLLTRILNYHSMSNLSVHRINYVEHQAREREEKSIHGDARMGERARKKLSTFITKSIK